MFIVLLGDRKVKNYNLYESREIYFLRLLELVLEYILE